MSASERLTREQIEEVLYTYSDVIPAVVAARFRDLLYQSALDSDNAVSGRESYRAGYSDGVAGVPPLWPLLGMPARSDNAAGQVPLQITAQQSVSDNAAYGPIQQHPGGQPYRVGVSTGATAPPIEILRAALRSAEARVREAQERKRKWQTNI